HVAERGGQAGQVRLGAEYGVEILQGLLGFSQPKISLRQVKTRLDVKGLRGQIPFEVRDGVRRAAQAFRGERHPELGLGKRRVQFRRLLEGREGVLESLLLEVKLPEVKLCDGELRVERERLLELLLRRVRLARERERPAVIQMR